MITRLQTFRRSESWFVFRAPLATYLQTVTFLELPEGVRTRLCWVCGRSAERSDSCASRGHYRWIGSTTGSTWNTVWSHIKPCLQTASFAVSQQACRYWELMSAYGIAGPTPPGPNDSPASWTTRGRIIPRPMDLVEQVWHRA